MTRLGRRLLLALVAVLAFAGTAEASTWGGIPHTGKYTGKVARGGTISFKVIKHGRRVGSFVIKGVPYACTNGDDQVVARGKLSLKQKKSVPIGAGLGYFEDIYPKANVPGGKVKIRVTGGFTAHHPIPPAAKAASGAIGASWYGPDGNYCTGRGDGGLDDWKAKLR